MDFANYEPFVYDALHYRAESKRSLSLSLSVFVIIVVVLGLVAVVSSRRDRRVLLDVSERATRALGATRLTTNGLTGTLIN